MRSKSQQMAERYLKLVRWSEEDACYVGSIPDLCGDCCHADTEAEVYAKLVTIAEDIVDGVLHDSGEPSLPAISVRPMREFQPA